MDAKELRESLDTLLDEVEKLPTEDPRRQTLHDLITQLEERLAASQIPADSADLNEQVDEAITHFEVEHPTVAGVLRRIMLALGSMGV